MASKGIKGITIEIGADTTGLDQALKKVNKTAESTATELKQVERMLKFDPSNTELLAQKQAILADQISNTSEKLKVLKTAQSQVQEQFDKGDIGADQYRAFQRELIKTESYLKSLQEKAESFDLEINPPEIDVTPMEEAVDLLKEMKDDSKLLSVEQNKLNSEFKLQQAQLGENATEVEKLGLSYNQLSQQMELSQRNVDSLEEQLKLAVTAFGENSSEVMKLESELNNAKTALINTENAMKGIVAEQDKLGSSTKQLENLFKATGTSIDDFSDTLGNDLTNAIKNGTASSKQLEKAFDLIGKSALDANVDLDKLRSALSELDKGVSLSKVSKELKSLADEAKSSESAVDGLNDKLSNLGGGLVAGVGIAGTIESALNMSSLDTKIEMTMDLDEASLDAVRESVMSVTSAIQDEEAALEGVRRQFALNADASVEENQKIIEGATAISYAYNDIDFKELIQESHEIGKELGISQQEALGMVDALLRVGFPPDQLDIISEYGNQLKMAGFNAQEIQAIMASGVDTGTWNIDNLLDGIKEGRIIGAEFGAEIDEATTAIIEKAGLSATKFQELGKAIASGGEEGGVAMQEMAKMLSTVADETTRNELGTKMYGTLWEEQGVKIVNTLRNMEGNMQSAAENQEGFNQSVERMNADPARKLQEALDNMMIALAPILTSVAELVGKIATWAAENPKLTATLVAIGTVVGIVVGAFALLAPAIAAIIPLFTSGGAVAAALSGAFAALTGPIGIAVAAIGALIAAGVALYKNWDEVVACCKKAWDSISSATSKAWESISSTISKVWETIESTISSVLTSIQTTISNIWNSINSTVTSVLNAIKTRITTVLNGIKSTITTIFNSIKNTISATLNAIKTVISNIWNGIKSTISNVLNSIKSTISTIFNSLKNTVSTAMNNVKIAIETGWNKAKSFLSSINLVQIGRDIINGLVKGIRNTISNVKKTVEGLASSLPKWVKKILGIHSPSRVFMELGEWIGIGLADGIESTESLNKKIVKNLTDSILEIKEDSKNSLLKIDKELAKEIQEINEDSEEKILKIQQTAAKKKRKLTTEESKQIEKLRQEAADKVTKLEEQAVADRAKIATNEKKQIDEHYKGLLENIKAFVDNKKSLNQLSLLDEAELWQKSMLLFEEGTEHRIKAQQEYRNAVESINKEIVSVNQNYQSQMQKINDDLVAQESALTKAYEDELNKRAATLSGFANIFDAYEVKVEKTGIDLINNLRSQVVALNQWRYQFESLSKRGILSDALLDEISEMGVDALDELIELNKLTDIQLTEYSNLYEEKMRSAREQAEKELEGTKNGVAFAIAIMREKAEVEMSKLEDEWAEDIRALTEVTETELLTMEQIGKNAGQGLLNGLSSMESSLKSKAKQIADNISKTIKDALQVKSPSRVMIGIGENVGEGLIIGMDDMLSKVSESSSRLSNALVSAQASMSSSSAKSQASQVTQQQIYHNQSIDMSGLIQAIATLAQRPIQTTVAIDGQAVGHAVSDYQYNNANLNALLRGVSL